VIDTVPVFNTCGLLCSQGRKKVEIAPPDRCTDQQGFAGNEELAVLLAACIGRSPRAARRPQMPASASNSLGHGSASHEEKSAGDALATVEVSDRQLTTRRANRVGFILAGPIYPDRVGIRAGIGPGTPKAEAAAAVLSAPFATTPNCARNPQLECCPRQGAVCATRRGRHDRNIALGPFAIASVPFCRPKLPLADLPELATTQRPKAWPAPPRDLFAIVISHGWADYVRRPPPCEYTGCLPGAAFGFAVS